MSTPDELEGVTELSTEPADLKPKTEQPSLTGYQDFTVCRQHDESGVSGEGVVIEGATFATGHSHTLANACSTWLNRFLRCIR